MPSERDTALLVNGLEPAPPPELRSRANRVATVGRLLWLARTFLARAVIVGLLASAVLALVWPKTYESTVRLVPPAEQSAGNLAGVLASFAASGSGMAAIPDVMGMKSSTALYIQVLQSRTLRDRVISRLQLLQAYGLRRWEKARDKLASSTTINEDRKSGVISVVVRDRDNKRAAAIANAYSDELNRLLADLNTSAAHRERVFLEGRLLSVKQELDQAAKDFSQFASKNTALDIHEQSKAMLESVALLQGQLIAAESELKGLQSIYTDNNVRVQSTRARVVELRRQLEKLSGVGTDASSGEFFPSIKQLPILGLGYAELYRRLKIQEVVYETLTKEYELAKVQEAKDVPSLRVLDSADVPEVPASPHRLQFVLLGGLLSLCVAAAWVLLADRWQRIPLTSDTRLLAEEISSTTLHSASRVVHRVRGKHMFRWFESHPREQASPKQVQDDNGSDFLK